VSDRLRIAIVGGVAGGASAATRARRLSESAEITIFERGPHVSFANCGLPYHIAGVIRDRDRLLVQTPESLRARFGLDVRVNTEVLRIDRKAKELVRASSTAPQCGQTSVSLTPSARKVSGPPQAAQSKRALTPSPR
jgi:NADH dehydrogenase FAD-containing subunit